MLCLDIFPKSKENFGGLFVYMFDDFTQLQRVKDIPLNRNWFPDDFSSKG